MTQTPLTRNEALALLSFKTDGVEPAPFIHGRRSTPECLTLTLRGVLKEIPTNAARRYQLTAMGIAMHAELEKVALAAQVVIDELKAKAGERSLAA